MGAGRQGADIALRPDEVVAAAGAFGWYGEVRGPVEFGGMVFYAACTCQGPGAPGSGWLVGCLVHAPRPADAIRDASLLAAYSPRAIVLTAPARTTGSSGVTSGLARGRGRAQGPDLIEIQLQTALLDQGAVVITRDGSTEAMVVSLPGEVVPSLLQLDDVWPTDRRWADLRQAVLLAPLVGELTAPKDGTP